MSALRFFTLSVLLGTFGLAQGQELKGIVKSKKEPLEFAYVFWKSNVMTNTATDSVGRFSINKIDNQDTLVISMVGFEPKEIIIPKEQNFIEIELSSSNILEGVNIGDVKMAKSLDKRGIRQISRFSDREFTKAACCNLSESFETISAVDVTTSDAVTGMKQIQMMGFSGIYIQTQVDNMPFTTGIISTSGLTYIPGIYVKGLQLSKGVGSVTNGYDGMTGSLNIELRKPTDKERLVINGFFNPMSLRTEGNIVYNQQVTNSWAATTMLHGSGVYAKADINKDGFQDYSLQNNLNIGHFWTYMNKNWEGRFGAKYMNYDQTLGVNDLSKTNNYNWQSHTNNERFEFESMLGKIFEDDHKNEFAEEHADNSMGFRANAVYHKIDNNFDHVDYLGEEKSVNLKWVFQGLAGSSFHKYMAGVSFYGNNTDEQYYNAFDLSSLDLQRREYVPGVFFEWTESSIKNLTLVAGLRYDYHNFFGSIITPRLHGKWDINENNEIRFGGGRGQRTANPLADYQGLFSSGRKIILPQNMNDGFYGLQQEVSWNSGISYLRTLKMFYRPASLVVDYYYTWFDNQLQVDRDFDASELRFYNLSDFGLKSYSNSASIELDFSPARRTEIRMSYRYIDSKSEFMDGIMRQNPLISPHRAFLNASYETKNRWVFDATVNWQSPKRLPQGNNLTAELQDMPKYSPSYTSVMAQITKKINKQWEVYIGGENLLNIVQEDLIRLASDPGSPYFDPTIIWGPSLGAAGYIGFRYYLY